MTTPHAISKAVIVDLISVYSSYAFNWSLTFQIIAFPASAFLFFMTALGPNTRQKKVDWIKLANNPRHRRYGARIDIDVR